MVSYKESDKAFKTFEPHFENQDKIGVNHSKRSYFLGNAPKWK